MKVLLLLLLSTVAFAASGDPAYVSAKTYRCGMVRRDIDQVQLWCYSGLAYAQSTALFNAIFKIKASESTVMNFNYGSDIVTWKFNFDGTSIGYDVVVNGTTLSGQLQ